LSQESQAPRAADTLSGTVERITYRHPTTGWTVARVSCEGATEPAVVAGALGDLAPGSRVQLEGRWTIHPVHGPQFEASRHEVLAPDTPDGLARYLGSGIFPGVGPRLAERIVKQFGLETLDVLDRASERLAEVPGLGPAKVAGLVQAWQAQRVAEGLMRFLQVHEMPTSHTLQILEAYGDEAVATLRGDPYKLLDDVRGLGFAAVDRLALRLGVSPDAPRRLQARLRQALSDAGADGHMALPREALLQRSHVAGVSTAKLEEALAAALGAGALIAEGAEPLIWLPEQRAVEGALAEGLVRLLRRPPEVMPDLAARLARVEASEALTLTPEQREAVLAAASSRLFVLTGGPGTGKTTSLRALMGLFDELELVVRLASPTGRAARRLAEVTGREATTLHRLLAFQPRSATFARGVDWPLEADVVLVDEASMLDAGLALALVRALPPLAHLVLVGDADQLPPVGPGQVLADLLACEHVPARHLTRVFRQAEQSAIVRSAHCVRRGEMPELIVPTGTVRTDCYFLEAETAEAALALIENVVARSLPARFGLDPVRDIQVLTPTNRGPLGAATLNQRLRQRLLPVAASEPAAGGPRLRRGDKVIQLQNDPDRGVFNGDLGIVETVDPSARLLQVRLADALVDFSMDEVDVLGLGWAITVHKSQGSEFPAVVMPLAASHGPMLQRRLLYTALTRARTVAVLVGQRSAIARAVASDEAARRITRLSERLLI
jgi:exodeoxyribonuclease V alpha subunit